MAQPTERQSHGWVDFAEITRKRDALPLGSDARTLISVYSMVPPRRNDLWNCPIFSSDPPEGTKGNYLVMRPKGPTTLVLQEYKTAKQYNRVDEDLPEALVTEIKANLARRKPEGRGYLFVAPNTNAPHKDDGTFSSWANALLKRTFRKPLTLTLMRHSFITALPVEKMTGMERLEIARKMGHSTDQQMGYRFVFRPETPV